MMMAVLLTMLCSSPIKAQNEVNIGKSNIKLSSKMLTPEALWAMGRISGYAASPDGKQRASGLVSRELEPNEFTVPYTIVKG